MVGVVSWLRKVRRELVGRITKECWPEDVLGETEHPLVEELAAQLERVPDSQPCTVIRSLCARAGCQAEETDAVLQAWVAQESVSLLVLHDGRRSGYTVRVVCYARARGKRNVNLWHSWERYA